MPHITQGGPIWTLDIGADENRFGPDLLADVDSCLDRMLADDTPAALVTIGDGKFYSNGLDLDWLGQNPEEFASYVDRVHGLFARVLTLPVPTVAALNGHAFGAGAMLALAHDYRVMRDDRGYFCLPEVDIQIPFTPGMSALIMAKLDPRSARDAMTTGRRFAAADALAAGIVDGVASIGELQAAAVGVVDGLAGKHRPTLGDIKSTMFAPAVRALAPDAG